jgi:hypothetical protein
MQLELVHGRAWFLRESLLQGHGRSSGTGVFDTFVLTRLPVDPIRVGRRWAYYGILWQNVTGATAALVGGGTHQV